MELWEIILHNAIKGYKGEIKASDIEKLFEKECYVVLEKIKKILEDDSLEDEDCFERIEALVCLYEEMGSECGTRHDFG